MSPAQRYYHETRWRPRLTSRDMARVLDGAALVMRNPERNQVDFIVRDHNMLDVLLYEWSAKGTLPREMFHLDRHSDFDPQPFAPNQYARWWGPLAQIRRPYGAPLVATRAVTYTTAVPRPEDFRKGRPQAGGNVGAAWQIPVGRIADLAWKRAIRRADKRRPGIVSIDLDGLQPSPQLALMKGLLRDPRFHRMMNKARVRVFVVSPLYIGGGDRPWKWKVNGSTESSLRLINWLRAERPANGH